MKRVKHEDAIAGDFACILHNGEKKVLKVSRVIHPFDIAPGWIFLEVESGSEWEYSYRMGSEYIIGIVRNLNEN